jgi:cation transport regulator
LILNNACLIPAGYRSRAFEWTQGEALVFHQSHHFRRAWPDRPGKQDEPRPAGSPAEGRRSSVFVMPYLTTNDLPDSVRGHLPPHAQAIYLAAFNNAWLHHASGPNAEAIVHRIAWSAVKRRYRKVGDAWVPIRP